MNNTQLINDICKVSKTGTCLLDMKQVAEKAKELGLVQLAQVVESDLESNQITTGQYYPMVASLFGAR